MIERPEDKSVTALLLSWRNGDRAAHAQLLAAVYDELRRLAASYLRRERREHTLQPTALVHEAYLQLCDQSRIDWHSRAHFFAAAAQVMRHVLIDYARRQRSQKRSHIRVPLSDADGVSTPRDVDAEALEQALAALAQLDPQLAELVELRYFGGLSIEEVAAVVGSSPATVKRHWNTARAYLKRELLRSGEQ
jgi:RNA polymerase sigma-70 factor (ECF subfamily)